MNAVVPAPLRKAAPLNNPVATTVKAGGHLPADPTPMIMKPLPAPGAKATMVRNILIAAGVLFMAEVGFPEALKPSVVIGKAVGRFHFETMTQVNKKEIELKEQEKIAERRAEIEAERAKWVGICQLGIMLDPQIAYKCKMLANGAFDAAADSIDLSKGRSR